MNKSLIFSRIDSSVSTMINKFRERFSDFVSENDLHCYLYHILYKNGINEYNKRLILHKEFPSCSPRGNGKRKGLFDIVILDPNGLRDKLTSSKVLVAMEFKLIKSNSYNQTALIKKDFKQITEELEKNKLEKGFVLIFSQIDFKHKNEILDIMKKYPNVNGYYINMSDKPKSKIDAEKFTM